MLRSFFVVTTIFLFSVCAKSDEYFSHSIIKMPYEYQVDYPWLMVLNNPEDFEAFYLSTASLYINSGFSNIKPMPEIDFEKYTLVVGGLGFQVTGGVKLAIGDIRESDSQITIQAYRVLPDFENCAVTADVAWPTIGILFEKTSKDIVAGLRDVQSSCP
jgi:hypothetical protein